MTKVQLRAEMKRRLGALSSVERHEKSAAICARVFELHEFKAAKTVLAYASFGNEVETDAILKRCLDDGKRLVLPRIETSNKSMTLRQVKDLSYDLDLNMFGIREPKLGAGEVVLKDVDLILMPGLAFDAGTGARVGWGEGYYDRLLNRNGFVHWLVGLAFEIQLFDQIEVEAHDVPVNCVVTESRTINPYEAGFQIIIDLDEHQQN